MQKLFIIILCFFSFQVFSQKNKAHHTIIGILENQTKYWNEGNLERFMEGYWRNDSLTFIGKNGLKYGYETALNNYKKGYPDRASMGTLAFDIKKVEKLSKKTYFVIGKWHLERPEKGNLEGHYSLIFRKIKREWVIISDHSS